ncbi:hypothetical protein M087_1201 [Bacteroides fragilis str. S23 R14]|nr:hypothetical protein M101_1243 [Bacteroides fragilis str. 1007-1-F \
MKKYLQPTKTIYIFATVLRIRRIKRRIIKNNYWRIITINV